MRYTPLMNKDTDPKKVLYWTAAAALALGAISTLWYVSAYARSLRPESGWNTFTVSAEGRATGVPDVSRFSFSVTTEGNGAITAAQEQNTKKMNDITAYLSEQGVGKEDVKTTSYNVSPRYQYFPCDGRGVCRPAEITGYTISQTVEVKVRDLEKSGEIVAGAVSRGANGVSGPSFVVDDPTEVQDEARAEAIAKARKKAETIAEQGGFALGKLLSISEDGGGVGNPIPFYSEKGGGMDMSIAQSSAPAFEPGSQEVMVNVSLTYAIR